MSNIKVSLRKVLWDMLSENGTCFWIITIVFSIIAIFLQLYYEPFIKPCVFYAEMVNVIPNILGFTITGLAILYGLEGIPLQRTTETASDGNNPFHVISASFSLTCISLLATFILSLLLKHIPFQNHCLACLFFNITLFLAIVSVLSLFNTIIHLFSMRTQITPMNHK